ncbi:hypothetical protein LXM25_05805 [Dyadobacter sp. LJ53]|uniref:hypothetical protein n=1 Tax=Dyadobacter chenwenxiniae TaxID=2906456 RepID=UPI001F259FC4|nr:hypothetical protein [Dyadobacter chenwenxiniae]MCF0049558.1 hypothetical protein [Dyadobacter chenwenxiniae]
MGDIQRHLFVHLQNNGVGPLIVEGLSFVKNGVEYPGIEECLTVDPKSYNHDIEISSETPKVILPGAYLEVFGMIFAEQEGEVELSRARAELAGLRLNVRAKDIYDKRLTATRSFQWFARHSLPTLRKCR